MMLMLIKQSKKLLKKITLVFCVAAIFFLSVAINAKNLGQVGQTYKIAEHDILDFIQKKLHELEQNGEINRINNRLADIAKKQADRPRPVIGVSRTKIYKKWDYDPSVKIPYDIKDIYGNIIAYTGTIINPLSIFSLKKALIFYNGDDKDQVSWAIRTDKKLEFKDKLILVQGSISAQAQKFQRNIFFDQQGRLVQKFNIRHVPAIVTQKGMHLKIEECVP